MTTTQEDLIQECERREYEKRRFTAAVAALPAVIYMGGRVTAEEYPPDVAAALAIAYANALLDALDEYNVI